MLHIYIYDISHLRVNEEKGKVIICVMYNIIPNLVDFKLCVYNSLCNCELFDQLIMYRHQLMSFQNRVPEWWSYVEDSYDLCVFSRIVCTHVYFKSRLTEFVSRHANEQLTAPERVYEEWLSICPLST